jgi:hypothetical protein
MSQIVKLRRSAVIGKRPTNDQLQLGELSINTTDGKLYFAKSGSLSASIEEVVTTNAQNTGSLNLSGSFNLIGTENITGSTKITGSLSVTGNTSLTSLVVSGSDPVANVQAYVPSSSIYNAASLNTPDRVASGIRFNWSNENWTIGAARGLTTDVDGLIFSRNGVKQMLLDKNNNLVLSGSINLTGSLYVNGAVVGTGKLDESWFNTFVSSSISQFAGTSSYALTASHVDNPIIVSGSTKKTTVTNGSMTWSLNHGMNERYPSITVFDSDGYVVIPTGVRAIDGNNIEVYFSQPQTGTVIATLGGGGTSGSNGTNGTSGSSGSSGLTGTSGSAGSSGTSGSNGTNGSSGTSGSNGSSGSNGTNGSSGTSGRDGIGGYTQVFSAQTTWSIAHNLDINYPIVTVWDSNKNVVIPSSIVSIDNNNIQVIFSQPIAGNVNVVRGGHMVSGSQDLSAVGTITPSSNGLYNLGSTSKQFNNVYISGSLLVNGVPYSGGSNTSGTSGINGTSGTSGDSIFRQSGSLYYTTSSLLFNNNLEISGTTTLGGNIVPKTPRGATLGTLTYPFADIFVSSGSINIAGVVGQPNTTLSNVSGNILISAGGMQLVGTGSFNAPTASFGYLSGTFTHIGSQFNIGDTVTTGSLQVSGSSIQIGNNTLIGKTSLSGSVNITGSLNINGLTTGATTDNIVTYNPTTKAVGTITGLTASQIPTRYYGAFYDLTTQTGSANVSQSVKLGNTQHANTISVVSGSRVTISNAGIYNLQFSTQLYRSSGGSTVHTYFWFRVNGIDVTNSNTALTTNNNNGYTVASWNYVDVYNAGDYVELMWMPDGSNVSLQYINAPAGLPSIPSVILTLTQV